MVERVTIYDNDGSEIWLSRPTSYRGRRSEVFWRVEPGDLAGVVWEELLGLPVGTRLDLAFDRQAPLGDSAVPRGAQIVRTIAPQPEPGRVIDAAPNFSLVEAMQRLVAERGLGRGVQPRSELAEPKALRDEPALATNMRRALRQRGPTPRPAA